MAAITLGGNPIHTSGELPQVGTKLADFKLITTDLSTVTLSDYAGTNLVLNILIFVSFKELFKFLTTGLLFLFK